MKNISFYLYSQNARVAFALRIYGFLFITNNFIGFAESTARRECFISLKIKRKSAVSSFSGAGIRWHKNVVCSNAAAAAAAIYIL